MTPAAFLGYAYGLLGNASLRKALARIYDEVDSRSAAEDWAWLDAFVASVDPVRTGSAFAVGVLTITAHVAGHLPHRATLVGRCLDAIGTEHAPEVLAGLE